MELIFVRHGRPQHIETSDGPPAAPPLAATGVRQAIAMAEFLSEEAVDHIYSSPMNRAYQTAEPLSAALELPINVREGLSEFDRNSTSYVPMEVLKETNRAAWERLASGSMGGSDGGISKWFNSAIQEVEVVVEQHPAERVAIICHGGVINAYLASCLNFSYDSFMKFDVDYTSITRVLASTAGHRSVHSINERPHFRGRPDLLTS